MTTARLQDHHLADLQASGLSDETIRQAELYSVTNETAAMLIGFGRSSALAFPYLHTANNGSPPFTRLKFDKPDAKGKRYAQAKGSGNRLYIPPMIDPAALTDASVTLYLTEGEKKALKAAQEGMTCVSVSGVDSWRSRRDGKSEPIADLDIITWKGRTVYIVFDSDLATKPPVRDAEFKLARELRNRGATVNAVRLPGGSNGAKVGLDDYLCTHSVEAFCTLEPEPIQHPAKEEVARAKAEASPADTVLREGDDFKYYWTADGIAVELVRLRDQPGGVEGEITVSVAGRPVHWARLNLASLSARETLTTKLTRTHAGHPWRDLLEQVCRETVQQFRTSTPTVQLHPARRTAERFLVDKLVVTQETNLLFADGGSGKSLMAMAVSLATVTGKTLPGGLSPHQTGPVLYLDYESCKEEHEDTLAGLLAGLDLVGPVPIFYRRMAGALADDLPAIRAEVARLAPVVVVVDSLGPACGAEPEGADAAVRCMNALRSLSPAKLVLAHVSKVMADQRGATRPFGSVFVMNLPRNVWEIRRAQEEGEHMLTVGLYHRKANRGGLLPPFGLQFEFSKEAIRITTTDVSQDAGLRERAGLSHGIKAALRSGLKSVPQLAEELDASEDSVRKTMGRLEKAGVVTQVGEQKSSGGRPNFWGLKALTGTEHGESKGVSK